MSPQQLTLAPRRLWLGISNVGFWVLAAGSGLYWLTATATDPAFTGGLVGMGRRAKESATAHPTPQAR